MSLFLIGSSCSLWISDRLYVSTQLCVVAMVSMSNTALQRLHALGGTVTSEDITAGAAGSLSEDLKVESSL